MALNTWTHLATTFDGQTLLYSIRADGSGMRQLADAVAGGLTWVAAPPR